MNEVLEVGGLKRSFVQAGVRIDVLRGVDLAVGAGEIVALLGPAGAGKSALVQAGGRAGVIVALLGPWGSGKSTLLQAVGRLEGGFEGSIRIAGQEVAELDDAERT